MNERFVCINTPNFRVVAVKESGWRFFPEELWCNAMGTTSWVPCKNTKEEILQSVLEAIKDGKTKSYDMWANEPEQLQAALDEIHQRLNELYADRARYEKKPAGEKREYSINSINNQIENWMAERSTIEAKIEAIQKEHQ